MSDIHAPDKPCTIHLSAFVMVRLVKAAKQRGIDPVTLAEKLLLTLARDRLIDAVLDDAPVKRRVRKPTEDI